MITWRPQVITTFSSSKNSNKGFHTLTQCFLFPLTIHVSLSNARYVAVSFSHNFTEGNCIFFQKRAKPQINQYWLLRSDNQIFRAYTQHTEFGLQGNILTHHLGNGPHHILPEWLYFWALPNTMEQCSFFPRFDCIINGIHILLHLERKQQRQMTSCHGLISGSVTVVRFWLEITVEWCLVYICSLSLQNMLE